MGGEGRDTCGKRLRLDFYETCVDAAASLNPLIPNPSPPEYRGRRGPVVMGSRVGAEPRGGEPRGGSARHAVTIRLPVAWNAPKLRVECPQTLQSGRR